MKLHCRDREIDFPRRPLVMGIVNINDDSFSGDGTLDTGKAVLRAQQLLEAGADIIDVGAESARPNRPAIAEGEEVARLRPFVERFSDLAAECSPSDEVQLWPPLLSVNTWRFEVVKKILPLGVDILNDIGGLVESVNAEMCAETGAALILMHTVGAPKMDHTAQNWDDVMGEMDRFFEEKIVYAKRAGLEARRLVIDPGIEFAKQRDDNLTVYRELERLHRFGRPILLPVSRKKVIGEVLKINDPAERDAGTIACVAAGMVRGAQIFRVHNVGAAAQSVKVLDAVLGRSFTQ
ncbi:dihydropteroate synthase [Arenicella sp.]|nr:dihydropteroate synthase [Arenicella sp.]